ASGSRQGPLRRSFLPETIQIGVRANVDLAAADGWAGVEDARIACEVIVTEPLVFSAAFEDIESVEARQGVDPTVGRDGGDVFAAETAVIEPRVVRLLPILDVHTREGT